MGKAAPAGWYSVAGEPGGLRYWDGAAWTDHRAPAADPAPRQAARGLRPVAAGIGFALVAVVLGAIVAGAGEEQLPGAATGPTAVAEEQRPAATETTPSTPGSLSESTPEAVAEGYALDKSGGARTGCSGAAPGAESEQNPGCAFFVAFTGCMEGQTGQQFGPLAVETEFPAEPALVALHEQAVRDCAR